MSKQLRQPAAGDTVATIKTNKGDIKVVLFPDAAPKAVENFTTHADNGYYDGVIFHRVIPDFMIQGGDPLGKGIGGESIWGRPFTDESIEDYKAVGGTPWLDFRHTVFGQVFEGMDVVDAIASVDRDSSDKPLEDVVINSVETQTL